MPMNSRGAGIEDSHPDVEAVIRRIDRAWREKQFDGLDQCFAEHAVITGPEHAVFAEGRQACAESYREFARNASVLQYTESGHRLRVFGATAVYTFAWEMEYRREGGSKLERGTDQLVLTHRDGAWQVAFRQITFAPAG